MATVPGPPVVFPRQCPRCASAMFQEYEEACCLSCGERIYASGRFAYECMIVAVRQVGPPKRGRPRKVRVQLEE